MQYLPLVVILLGYAGAVIAALRPYAPMPAVCPTTPLIRPALSISSQEASYISQRYLNASAALASWLYGVSPIFTNTTTNSSMPVAAFAHSGGGYRALLVGAGFTQALDIRDSKTGLSGLYQGLTYETGVSGGAWLLSSIAGNNYPTVSSLYSGLWRPAFQDGLLEPGNLLTAAEAYGTVVADLLSKAIAGFDPTLVDAYGRLLSYQLLYGSDGGVNKTLSGLRSLSNFTSLNVPFPIVLADGLDSPAQCLPTVNCTSYEFHPYEVGSWDAGVHAFAQTQYVGSPLNNGAAVSCTTNYDNLGYVLGTSSDVLVFACAYIPGSEASNSSTALAAELQNLVNLARSSAFRDDYAVYPNPFYNYSESTLVSAERELDMTDGGIINDCALWPLLHRDVDVTILNDNNADTSTNFPNGSCMVVTYQQALAANLTRMPVVPSSSTFTPGVPLFFGCNDTSKIDNHLRSQQDVHVSEQHIHVPAFLQHDTVCWHHLGWRRSCHSGEQHDLAALSGLCHREEIYLGCCCCPLRSVLSAVLLQLMALPMKQRIRQRKIKPKT